MRKYIKLLIVLSTIFFTVHLNYEKVFAENSDTEKYERDYLSRIFDSENGLEGATANSVCADEDGFLWFGSYTGLYRYDGTEFKKYLINNRAVPVNDIIQDKKGNLWIGTNGDGVYRFDGNDFKEFSANDNKTGASVINELFMDSQGIVWIGTKAGLYSIDTAKNEGFLEVETFFTDMIIQDIGELADGSIIIVRKTGGVYLLNDDNVRELELEQWDGDGIPRCCYGTDDGNMYIGTTGGTLLKVSESGKILFQVNDSGLSSFNEIEMMKKDDKTEYWVCSDTGIGLINDDGLVKLDLAMDDSIEECCEDYQGNLWFVSSRQGVMQLYQNCFSNLGAYWNITQPVNSIQPYGNHIYVGCDDGLYCYDGKNQVEDSLTEACRNLRIRQIYEDNDKNLWVSTYQNGIVKMDASGGIVQYTTDNSGLSTNKIRCFFQKADKNMLVGTEEGLYQIDTDGQITKYTNSNILNSKRILDIDQQSNGKIYASTDGYGIYEIENGDIKNVYSKNQGLLSNVVMKIVPAKCMDGIWAVTGEGICLIDNSGQVSTVNGIHVANCLDLLIDDDGMAYVLAGNGFFEVNERDLLKDSADYIYMDKNDGLPVDFTANARNIISSGILYMCGTVGAATVNLNEKHEKKPVKLYINSITEDGKDVDFKNGNIIFSSGAHRINIDVQLINFVHRNIYSSYYLEGTDKKKTVVKDQELSEISYTNLKCGDYTYQYKVYDADTDSCLAEISISFHKNYRFLEQIRVKVLITILFACMLMLLFTFLAKLREKSIKKQYYLEFLQEKEAEISELAYKDLVTGVYNRNFFEQEKDKVDLKKMRAMVSVSINYIEYFKSKYGVFSTENILRAGVSVLEECTEENIRIFRVSESVFYFWFMEPVNLETYIHDIKEHFKKKGEKDGVLLSFAVGAIYNNTVGNENIDELIDRCCKMRLLDEKHAEAKFIEGKMKML